MAGIIGTFVIPKLSMTAATAKTVLQVIAPTNQRLKVLEITVYFDSTSTTPGSARVRLLRQTTAGTVTAISPVAWENELTESLQATGGSNASAEPTNAGAGAVVMDEAVPITSGFIYPFPQGQELFVGGGTRLGIEVTTPTGTTINCYGHVKYEE